MPRLTRSLKTTENSNLRVLTYRMHDKTDRTNQPSQSPSSNPSRIISLKKKGLNLSRKATCILP
jgi:hypothetical protein